MKNELTIQGTQNFMGFDIPVVSGGFSKDGKCILAKTFAELNEAEYKKINQLINNNIDEFEFGVDILDLKQTVLSNDRSENLVNMLLEAGFTSQNIKVSKSIYVLSEQGVVALSMLMKTPRAKEVRKTLKTEYFRMRELIKEMELDSYMIEDRIERATKWIEEEQERVYLRKNNQILIQEVQEKEIYIEEVQPKVDSYQRFIDTDDCFDFETTAKLIGDIGRNKLTKILRERNILQTHEYPNKNNKITKGKRHNRPYQRFIDAGFFRLVVTSTFLDKVTTQTLVTPLGLDWIKNGLLSIGKIA